MIEKPGNRLIDLTGQKFGRLIVIKRSTNKNNRVYWECICDCGNIKIVSAKLLRNGESRSCGCLRVETMTTHGLSNCKIYEVWSGMINRCEWQGNTRFHRYGARGINICEEWRNNFEHFYNWAVNNGFQKGLQLDRKDNDGNYEPDNCRFVTPKVNVNNRPRLKYKNLPKGVYPDKYGNGKFQAQWSEYKICHYIGTYNTVEEAAEAVRQYVDKKVK